MLVLKLLLVPAFLLSVSLVERRFGPAIGGWIAGMPMVTGPILFVLALERGPEFTAAAAAASTSAVCAAILFGAAYAWSSRQLNWPYALTIGLSVWTLVVWLLSLLPSPQLGWVAAALTLGVGPRLFPDSRPPLGIRPLGIGNLVARMVGGAMLTWVVAWGAGHLGSGWTGLIAVFPLISTVLAVSTHMRDGPEYSGLLLRGMATGMYALASFCLALTVFLDRAPIALAFVAAIAAGVGTQLLTRRLLLIPKARSDSPRRGAVD